jgi:hypothetical protein
MVAKAKRGADGRFLKGTPAGPGRPCRETEQAYYNAFTLACSPQDLAAVVASMVGLAKAGDINAAKLVMGHALPAMVRMDLLIHVAPELQYRVAGAGRSATDVNATMLTRLHESIRRTRSGDQAARSYQPKKSDYEGRPTSQE